MRKSGFKRLKGAAVAGVMGMGVFGAGNSARAATVALPQHIVNSTGSGAYWWGYIFPTPGPSTLSQSSAIDNLYWAFNPGVTNALSGVSAFAISDAGLAMGNQLLVDAYDAAFQFAVNGQAFSNPDGTVDLTGNVLTTDTVLMSAGVHATMQLAFGVGRPGVLRALYSFHNPGATPVSITVHIGGDLGSDGNTVLIASQSGDLQVTEADAWYVSNDSNGHTGDEPWKDPNFLLCRFTPGADIIPLTIAVPGQDVIGVSDHPEIFLESYDLTLNPDETARIVLFSEMTATNAEAIAGAASCNSSQALLDDGLLAGLSDQQISEIKNISPLVQAEEPQAVPTLQAAALLGLAGALAALGVGGVRRRAS